MQMIRDSSAEQIVQRHKQQLAQRKINYGQHVKELYMPDTSAKKVRQSELMLRNEFNPHIKIRGRKLSLSHGGARSHMRGKCLESYITFISVLDRNPRSQLDKYS